MFCKKCGAEIRDSAKFCHKCGTAILKRTEKKKMIRIVSLVISFVILLGACSGVFIFRDEIFSLFFGYEDVYSEVDEILQESIVCEAFRAASINERKEIVGTTLNNLEAKGEIKEDSVTYSDGGYFYFNFLNGAEGIISINDPVDGLAGESMSTVYWKNEGKIEKLSDDYNRIPDFNALSSPYVGNDKKALIIDELGYEYNSINFEEDKKEWSKCHLQTTIEQNFTVQQFKTELSKYDYISIQCHGPAKMVDSPRIYTNEEFGHDIMKYSLDLGSGRIGAFYSCDANVYVINPSFFTYYYKEDNLKDKIIWVGCCNGFRNDKLVSAFAECGAKAVIGSTESVNSLYGAVMCSEFVYHLLCGKDAETSLNAAKNCWGVNDEIFNKASNSSDTSEFRLYIGYGSSGKATLFTLTEEAKKALNGELEAGSISGTITDESGNPIENAEVTAMATLSDTISNKKAQTDSDGYYKIECNPENYKIKVIADGYEEYNSDKVINVEKDFETILDTIKLKKIKKEYTESELKEIVLAESGGNIGAWVYEDFDGDGTKEAYAVITNYNNSMTKSDRLEAVYFINQEGDTTRMPGDFWGGSYYGSDAEVFSSGYRHSNEYTTYQGKGFFSFDSGNGGSGWQTLLYSVKDGLPYELDISRTLQGFYEKDDTYYTTENEFLEEGGHEFPEVELIYDSSTQQFSKGDRITSEEDNKISDWKKAYIEVLSNLNYSTGRFTTAYIDEDDIPELIVAYDSSHVAGCEIYTYYDGKVSKLEGYSPRGEFGSSGGILYSPYKNLFNSRYYGMGSNGDELFRINNGNAQLECYLQHNDYFAGVRVIEFKIDGADVTEDEFWDKYNSYEIDSMVSANYDDMIEANSTNISNYFN